MWLAIISDVGSMLAVTLNGMRLLPRAKDKHALTVVADDGGDDEESGGRVAGMKDTIGNGFKSVHNKMRGKGEESTLLIDKMTYGSSDAV